MIGHQDEVARREEGVPCVHLAPALRNRLARRRELHVPARAGIAPRRAAAPRGLGGNRPESLAPGRPRHDARKERLPPADRGGEEKEAEPALVEFQVHARDSTRWSRRRQSRANDRGLRPRTPGASTAPPRSPRGSRPPPGRWLLRPAPLSRSPEGVRGIPPPVVGSPAPLPPRSPEGARGKPPPVVGSPAQWRPPVSRPSRQNQHIR